MTGTMLLVPANEAAAKSAAPPATIVTPATEKLCNDISCDIM